MVILVSASPNWLGTILLISIFSSLSAALSEIGPVPRTMRRQQFLLAAEDDDLAAAGAGDVDERRAFRVDDVKRERIVREQCGAGVRRSAMASAIDSGGSSSSSSTFGLVQDPDPTQERVVRVEGPQGVERPIANFDRRLVHQLAHLQMRCRLVDGRQSRQGVGAELRQRDDGLAQDIDARCIVEIRQGLGAEVAHLRDSGS